MVLGTSLTEFNPGKFHLFVALLFSGKHGSKNSSKKESSSRFFANQPLWRRVVVDQPSANPRPAPPERGK
jgi:hypothetical protein